MMTMKHDVAAALEDTIEKWCDMLLGLDDAVVRTKPSVDRWSLAEVIGHLMTRHATITNGLCAPEVKAFMFPKYDQTHG